MDTLREDDLNQMRLLSKELSKMRKEDKVPLKKQGTFKKENTNTSNRPMTGNNTAVRNNRAQQSLLRNKKIRK